MSEFLTPRNVVMFSGGISSWGRGQCDARCYDGDARARCRCICGGANHGKGRALASTNSKAIKRQWAETFREQQS